MAKENDWYKAVAGHQRVSHLDGHDVNESYKVPSATGKPNPTYMHPHLKPLSTGGAFKAADKALGEAERPANQMGRSKTVFPVNDQKARGVPKPPPAIRPSRAPSHAPAPTGVIPGPVKPTLF